MWYASLPIQYLRTPTVGERKPESWIETLTGIVLTQQTVASQLNELVLTTCLLSTPRLRQPPARLDAAYSTIDPSRAMRSYNDHPPAPLIEVGRQPPARNDILTHSAAEAVGPTIPHSSCEHEARNLAQLGGSRRYGGCDRLRALFGFAERDWNPFPSCQGKFGSGYCTRNRVRR